MLSSCCCSSSVKNRPYAPAASRRLLRDENFSRSMKRIHCGHTPRNGRHGHHDDRAPQPLARDTTKALGPVARAERTPLGPSAYLLDQSRRPRVTTFPKAGRGLLLDPVVASTLNFRHRRPFLDLDSARFWEERHGQKLKHTQGSSTAGTFGNAPASSPKGPKKLGFVDGRQFEVLSSVREARQSASQQQRGMQAPRKRETRGRRPAPAMCRTTLFSFVSGYGAAGCVVGSSGGQYEPRSSGVLSHKTTEGGGGWGLDNANLGMGPHAVSKAYFGDRP